MTKDYYSKYILFLFFTIIYSASYSQENIAEILPKSNNQLIGRTLDNENIFWGKKPLLLSFAYFACRPCMLEIPYLNKLHEKYKNEIDIVAIIPHNPVDIKIYQENIDTTSVFCRIRKMGKYERINYKIIPECKTKDTKSKDTIAPECDSIRKYFNIPHYPTCILINNEGTIINSYTGFNTYDADSIITKIETDIISISNK